MNKKNISKDSLIKIGTYLKPEDLDKTRGTFKDFKVAAETLGKSEKQINRWLGKDKNNIKYFNNNKDLFKREAKGKAEQPPQSVTNIKLLKLLNSKPVTNIIKTIQKADKWRSYDAVLQVSNLNANDLILNNRSVYFPKRSNKLGDVFEKLDKNLSQPQAQLIYNILVKDSVAKAEIEKETEFFNEYKANIILACIDGCPKWAPKALKYMKELTSESANEVLIIKACIIADPTLLQEAKDIANILKNEAVKGMCLRTIKKYS